MDHSEEILKSVTILFGGQMQHSANSSNGYVACSFDWGTAVTDA